MRRMDEAKEGCLLDSLTHVVPALATSIEKLSGLQKIYAERTLGQILGVANGTSEVDAYLESGEASASIKKLLNSVYLQRLMRLVEKMEEDDEFDDMGL